MNATFHYIEQRTTEWDELRAGKLTASQAKKLVTPTGKPSLQYRAEIARIIAEHMGLQEPEPIPPTFWMERGVEIEPEARAWFEVETGLEVIDIGFVASNDGYVGASPDGLIMDGAYLIPLELKCPKPSTHIRWYLDGVVPKDHIAQVHFQMALCATPYAYFSSYHPELPPLIVKVDRSDYTMEMVAGIKNYIGEYQKALATITGE
jgi:hypothetical protein